MRGAVITQVHTRDNRSGIHEMDGGATASLIGNQEDDFVVTSDGVKHPL